MNDNDTQVSEFTPFYEKWAGNVPTKLFISLGLGLTFFVLHRLILGPNIYAHYGWMLSLLISSAALFQYYATATFRNVLSEMKKMLPVDIMESLLKCTNQVLSDRAFLISGLFFAFLNTAIGFLFGLPPDYQGWLPTVSTYTGFFLVGFVCGIPACGIYGVCRVINKFAREDKSLTLDYTARDERAGMQFIGEALVNFASVTVTMGVLILLYILKMPWTRSGSLPVTVIFWLWVVWPFLLSIVVFIVPGVAIHRTLEVWQQKEVDKLQKRSKDIEAQIETSVSPETENLLKKYEHYAARRAALYKVSTWPYGITAKINYMGVFSCNIVVAATGVLDHWEHLSKELSRFYKG